MTEPARCEWVTAEIRCPWTSTVTMSIVTSRGRRTERALCSRHARRYAEVMGPKLAPGVSLLQYDFTRHREVS